MDILLIEDDMIDQMAFERAMKPLGYTCTIVDSIEKAKELLKTENFDIIISDYQLPDGFGLELLELNHKTPVIMVTGTGREEVAVSAMKAGAADYLIKDINRAYLTLLPTIISQILKIQKTKRLVTILEQTIKTVDEGIYITDNESNIIFANKAFTSLFGYDVEQIIDKPESFLFENNQQLLLNTKTPQHTATEFDCNRPDGTSFPCLITRSSVEDETHQKIATVSIFKDISEHVESEKALRKKAEELARTRAELEHLELFSFVTTHDLQEPLHKIITFSNLLLVDENVVLSEATAEYRNKIIHATEELSQMISQLRDYSKILTDGESFTPVNLNSVVNEVLDHLKSLIDSLHAQIKLDKLPHVHGDQRQLYKLFMNLIKNALIFHNWDSAPEIHITASENDYAINIDVRDNGIGIDEKFLHKLFKPFCRLHTTAEYPGRGLGLAICKKIAQRHKGDITVKSIPSKGSVFTLSFPRTMS